MQKTDRTALLGYLTAPISGSAADGPSFSSSSHANHFSAAGSYSPVRTISRAFSNPELVREDTLRRAEEHLSHAVDVAKAGGVTLAELTETLNLLYGDETL